MSAASAVTVHIDDATWTIANDQLALTLHWSDTSGLTRGTLIDHGSGHTWPASPAPLFRVVWNERERDSRMLARPVFSQSVDGTTTLIQLRGALADDLIITFTVALAPGHGVWQQWVTCEARAPGELGPVQFDLTVAGDQFVLSRVRGVQQQGGWTPANGAYESFQVVEAPLEQLELVSGERSTWREMPWLLLRAGDAGVFAGLLAMGQWHAGAVAHSAHALVTLGATGYTRTLVAGTTQQSEIVFVGLSTGDRYDAARVQRRFMRAVLPPLPTGFPWVQYNTWYSLHCEVDEPILQRELAVAADLGCEVFYIDAGWWAGSARRGDHFSSGLGLWREHAGKFPRGMRAFADDVRAAGLHFGIWVEPERVDLRTASDATWHEAWLATGDDGFSRVPWPPDTDTGWLCYGQTAVQAWAIGWVSDLVERLGVRWLKWDSNWWGVCTNPAHGHGAHDGEPAQLAGVLHVWATLRARFPDLVIENCAGGGTRLDFASMAGSHAAWLSDATEPGQRVRQHTSGVGTLYPPERSTIWVVDSVAENMRLSLPETAIATIFRSRMLGALGISARLADWPSEAVAAARAQIADYKQLRGHLVRGDLYTLLPQPVLHGPDLRNARAYDAYQIADGETSVVLVFRNLATEPTITLRLRALDSNARYTVIGAGEPQHLRGAALQHDGLRVALPVLGSALIHVVRIV